MHTTSAYLCILLLHTGAYYYIIPVHTTSAYLCILLLHTCAYYFFVPVHTASSYRCILILHTCAYYFFTASPSSHQSAIASVTALSYCGRVFCCARKPLPTRPPCDIGFECLPSAPEVSTRLPPLAPWSKSFTNPRATETESDATNQTTRLKPGAQLREGAGEGWVLSTYYLVLST